MFTSDTDNVHKIYLRTSFIYLLVSLFCLLFGAVYEEFSHNVYSSYMIYAFAIPLVGGSLPFLTLARFGVKKEICFTARSLWHCGIATLTVGSIFTGVIEIFGTVSSFSAVYAIVGMALCAAGLAACVISLLKKKNQ